MLENEQDFNRNFCPKCLHHVNGIKCEDCGTEDLIPKPDVLDINKFAESQTKIYDTREIEELYKELTEPEKSPLDLDENAVNKLLREDFGFLTGLAGSGKSTLITEISRLHPNLLELCSTTGISAVNLGCKTVNSTLKYFDTRSLENVWRDQTLHYNLRLIRSKKQKLLIDEISMMDAAQLDLIVNAIEDINSDKTGKKLGLWLCGDHCQLPPIKAKYVFHSNYWERFEKNTIKLEKIWRQDNKEFIKGINLIRAGKASEAMEIFKSCGVHFIDKIDDNFEGTTLISKNDEVDAYNLKRLNQINEPLLRSCVKKLGKQLPEWEKNIPFELRLKLGAYVMILANDIPNFNYVNGDTGHIVGLDKDKELFDVKLIRTGKIVKIGRIERLNLSDKEPSFLAGNFQHYSDYKTGDWIIGKIYYHPLRLAYASTIHKAQGLSLELVQIDTRAQFFGFDSMGYVALSRARSPEGLYLVGKPEIIGKKIRMSKEVLKYV